MADQMVQWIWEHPNVAPEPKPKTSSSRRAHQKSRKGCISCKKKRIKCDETKPQCEQCAHRRIACEYLDPAQTVHDLSATGQTIDSVSREAFNQKIMRFMDEARPPCDELAHPKYLRIHALELSDHWFHTNGAWIGQSNCQKVMQQSAFEIGLERDAPYLVHSILAFSACHLNFLNPEDPKWAIASVIHYSTALKLYVRQLQDYIVPDNSDQMIGCCTLLEMMAFWNLSKPASGPSKGLDLSDDLATMKTMRGSCFLRGTPGLYADGPKSIWRSVYNVDLCFHGEELFHIDSSALLPPGLTHANIQSLEYLCEVNSSGTLDDNIYYVPIQRLKKLMILPPDRESIGWFMQWAGRLDIRLMQALERQDERALLLLAFWAALFLQIDQWWIKKPATLQCLQICEHLEQHASHDVLALLEFPARSCGARV